MTSNIVWHNHQITKQDRTQKTTQKPCIIWFTGLSGSGKSSIANALEEMLFNNDNLEKMMCCFYLWEKI